MPLPDFTGMAQADIDDWLANATPSERDEYMNSDQYSYTPPGPETATSQRSNGRTDSFSKGSIHGGSAGQSSQSNRDS